VSEHRDGSIYSEVVDARIDKSDGRTTLVVLGAFPCRGCSKIPEQTYSCVLTRYSIRGGTFQLRWHCWHCGRNPGHKGAYFKNEVNAALFALFPSLAGFVRDPQLMLPETMPVPDIEREECSVDGCEDRITQWHHFAPRFIFDYEAHLWPCLPLCMKHHLEWHRRVTPRMSKKEAGQ